jgi:excisionase family DNA binding protein
MGDPSGDDFVTAEEACVLLGIKTATLYAYVSRGLVRSYQQGSRRQRRYRRSELNALRQNPTGTNDSGRLELPEADTWVGDR